MRSLQDMLQLSRQQQKQAKLIWKDWHEALAPAKVERQRILFEMQASGAAVAMRQGMQPDKFSDTDGFLEQAAALAENCAIQQEISLHSQHRFLLQVLGHQPLAVEPGTLPHSMTKPICPICKPAQYLKHVGQSQSEAS